MKAISLWQPWASLWACGRKHYETRHWEPKFRGPIAIHAAKKLCTDIDEELRAICEDEFGGHWAMDLPRGAIIGMGELVRCIKTDGLQVDEEEFAQGNFGPGRFAWELQNRRKLDAPAPFRGHQSIFDWPTTDAGVAVPNRQGSLL